MNTAEIKKLLDSFYNGETNQSEELLLLNYFNSSDVAEELREEQEIFLQLNSHSSIKIPKSLETNLNNLIDELAIKEKKKTISRKVFIWSSIAASIAVIFTLAIHFNAPSYKADYSSIEEEYDETSDKSQFSESDFKVAEKALLILTSNFNKGMEQLDAANNNLENANKILNEAFKPQRTNISDEN